jgi:hypothetical protein
MDQRENPNVIPINQARTEVLRRVEEHDKRFLDPTERAEAVTEWLFYALERKARPGVAFHLDGPDYWDLLCFSVNFIGQAALGSGDEKFIELAKLVSQWVHNAHYSMDHPKMLGESRAARLAFWASKIRKAKGGTR